MYMGLMRFRCYNTFTGTAEPRLCHPDLSGNGGCKSSEQCAHYGRNPYLGYTGFDHIGLSTMVMVQCLTLCNGMTVRRAAALLLHV